MRRNKSVLTSNVNFYVSVAFIAAFGLTATSFLLKFAQLEDPIANTLSGVIVTPGD